MFGKQYQRSQRSTAMVGLLALVLLQFSAAAHQFDHAASDAAESCTFCLQIDRSGDAPVTHDVVVQSPRVTSTTPQDVDFAVQPSPIYRYKSRGPPKS